MSHVGHDSARHPNDPEKVRIEDRPGLFDRALFGSGRGDTEAGIVHEHVDAALQAHHFPDGGLDGVIASHVQRQHLERSFARLRTASAGAVDLVPSHREPLRSGGADA